MKAKNHYVLVEKIEQQVSGSIILPDKKREDVSTGRVVSVGSECPIELKQGDKVLYPDGEGKPIDSYIILNCDAIMAKVED